MKTVFKYGLQFKNFQKIGMFKDAEILKVDLQRNKLCLWALIDTEKEMEQRIFIVIKSGEELPTNRENLHYLNSCFLFKENETNHVFELKYKEEIE